MTTAPFTRTLLPYTFTDHRGRQHPAFVKVEWDGHRLTLSGVEGPKPNGNSHGSCGQTVMGEWGEPAPGWTPDMIERLRALWNRWHLNDLRAGTPAQMAWLSEHEDEFPGYPVSHYDWAVAALHEAGLNPDPGHNGYQYGHAWLTEEVPDSVLDVLLAFPESTKTPAWV